MAKWMQVQLAHGQLADGRRLFSTAQASAMWKPYVVVSTESFGSASAVMAAISPKFQDYGLGWFIEDYHGHLIVEHTGAVLGAVAALYLIPEKNIGIAVMINSEDGAARRAVAFHLLDYYLGISDQHWNETLKQLMDGMETAGLKALKAQPERVQPNEKFSLPLAKYAGDYRDSWYGSATVSLRDGRLWMKFDKTPRMEGPLTHTADDTFRVDWSDRTIEAAYVKFGVTAGIARTIEMSTVSPLADFSFDYKDLHFSRER
jgi:hypothetical protein